MLKQRLITAFILIPVVFGLLFFAKPMVLFSIVILFLVLLGLEWQRLIPLTEAVKYVRWYQALWIIVLLCLLWPVGHWFNVGIELDLLLWVGILFAVLGYPASQRFWGYTWVVAIAGWLLLTVFACCMIGLYLMPHGKALLVYVLVLVWATDIGAYFAGKRYGKRKLIEKVSPGKTVEGSCGGVVLAMIVAWLASAYLAPSSMLWWYVISISSVLMAMLGDLSISMLKRRCQVKDTGTIFPGHGGALDRLDSLIAALPVFFILYAIHPVLGS